MSQRSFRRERLWVRWRIVGHGGSAGGLLMGQLRTSIPLFGALSRSTFVDVDDHVGRRIAADAARMARMGQSDHKQEDYDTILAYSIDQVENCPYPAMLITVVWIHA